MIVHVGQVYRDPRPGEPDRRLRVVQRCRVLGNRWECVVVGSDERRVLSVLEADLADPELSPHLIREEVA